VIDVLEAIDPWVLPSPLDAVAAVALLALRAVVAVVLTATRNVAVFGPWWPVVYWLSVWWLLGLGARGAVADAKVFSGGEDVLAYGTGRANWLGAAASVTRLRVRLKANLAAGRIVVGYGGATVLLVCGVLGVWLLVLAALAVAAWWRLALAPRWWVG